MPARSRPSSAPSSTDPVRLSGVGIGHGPAGESTGGINLILPAGSFHFLTGPSGSGKSALLDLIALMRRPDTGLITLFGQPTDAATPAAATALRRRIGVVPQDLGLLDHLSAFDNAALPLRLRRQRPADYAGDVAEMLAFLGLTDQADAPCTQLSASQRQRLCVARAVVTGPELILADDPTSALDAAETERVLGLFQSLNRLGTTVLIAGRDADMAARWNAQTLWLEDGQLTDGPSAPARRRKARRPATTA